MEFYYGLGSVSFRVVNVRQLGIIIDCIIHLYKEEILWLFPPNGAFNPKLVLWLQQSKLREAIQTKKRLSWRHCT